MTFRSIGVINFDKETVLYSKIANFTVQADMCLIKFRYKRVQEAVHFCYYFLKIS